MKIKATTKQLAQLLKNAFDASVPMGMGFLHYDPKGVPLEHFQEGMKEHTDPRINLDYVQGRMVKLSLRKDSEGQENVWELPDTAPRLDYQSWASKYPTYRDLALSVEGIEVLS